MKPPNPSNEENWRLAQEYQEMAADHGKKVVLADEEQNPGGVCLPFARRRQIGQVSLGQSMTDG